VGSVESERRKGPHQSGQNGRKQVIGKKGKEEKNGEKEFITGGRREFLFSSTHLKCGAILRREEGGRGSPPRMDLLNIPTGKGDKQMQPWDNTKNNNKEKEKKSLCRPRIRPSLRDIWRYGRNNAT